MEHGTARLLHKQPMLEDDLELELPSLDFPDFPDSFTCPRFPTLHTTCAVTAGLFGTEDCYDTPMIDHGPAQPQQLRSILC